MSKINKIVIEEIRKLNENYKGTLSKRERDIALLIGKACYTQGINTNSRWESVIRTQAFREGKKAALKKAEKAR